MKYTTVFPNNNIQYIWRALYNNLIYDLNDLRNFVNIREIPGKQQLCSCFQGIKRHTGRKIFYFLKADITCGMFSKHINYRSKNMEFNVEKDHTGKKTSFVVLNIKIIDSFFLATKKDIQKMSYDFNMIKKSVIPFPKKKQDTEKHSSFVRKNRQKPRRTEVVKLFCGAFVIKMAMKSFSKQITMRMEKKFLQLSTIQHRNGGVSNFTTKM